MCSKWLGYGKDFVNIMLQMFVAKCVPDSPFGLKAQIFPPAQGNPNLRVEGWGRRADSVPRAFGTHGPPPYQCDKVSTEAASHCCLKSSIRYRPVAIQQPRRTSMFMPTVMGQSRVRVSLWGKATLCACTIAVRHEVSGSSWTQNVPIFRDEKVNIPAVECLINLTLSSLILHSLIFTRWL